MPPIPNNTSMSLRCLPVDRIRALARVDIPEAQRAIQRPAHDALSVELKTCDCVAVALQGAHAGALETPHLVRYFK